MTKLLKTHYAVYESFTELLLGIHSLLLNTLIDEGMTINN